MSESESKKEAAWPLSMAVELRRFLYPTYDSDGNVSRKIMDLEPGDCQRILNDFASFLGMEEGS